MVIPLFYHSAQEEICAIFWAEMRAYHFVQYSNVHSPLKKLLSVVGHLATKFVLAIECTYLYN